ncbi:hypothetical protein SUGI_0474540 [Cryptomeria japonica]|nr:hypothetical protein SUGI_0474540 [Cryptomeria japonica]
MQIAVPKYIPPKDCISKKSSRGYSEGRKVEIICMLDSEGLQVFLVAQEMAGRESGGACYGFYFSQPFLMKWQVLKAGQACYGGGMFFQSMTLLFVFCRFRVKCIFLFY